MHVVSFGKLLPTEKMAAMLILSCENSLITNEFEILYSEEQFSGKVSHGMLLDMFCISEGCLSFAKAISTCERVRNASVCCLYFSGYC